MTAGLCARPRPGGLDLSQLTPANRVPATSLYWSRVGRVTALRSWPADLDAARALCAVCPLLDACRATVLEATDADGFAGGMTSTERRAWRRRAGVTVALPAVRDVLPPSVAQEVKGARLTEHTVALVSQYRAGGWQRDEIAAALGITPHTVAQAVSIASARSRS